MVVTTRTQRLNQERRSLLQAGRTYSKHSRQSWYEEVTISYAGKKMMSYKLFWFHRWIQKTKLSNGFMINKQGQ